MRLLIVDDETEIREIIRDAVVGDGVFPAEEVLEAASAEEGLSICESSRPGVVVTDVMMGKTSGIEMSKVLRERHIEAELIVITGAATLEMARDIVKLGAYDFLTKPFDLDLLSKTISHARDRRALRLQNEIFRHQLIESEKLSSLGLLSAGVAHEINNPNTFVTITIELVAKTLELIRPALDGTVPPGSEGFEKAKRALDELPGLLQEAMSGVKRVSRIVKSLLSISRTSYEQIDSVPLQEAVEETLTLVAHRTKPHSLRVIGVEGAPAVKGNLSGLTQVIMNLVVNSIDAIESSSKGRGEVCIEVAPKDSDTVSLVVRDSGPGISPTVRKTLFQPFFTSKAPGKGTGLGLWISKRTIESFGGSIEARETNGNGAEIAITLKQASGGAR